MPRRRRHARRWSFGTFDFVLGPVDVTWQALTERERRAKLEALGRAWGEQGAEFVERERRTHPGSRCWAWWEFTAGEPMPSYTADGPAAEVERLLELDELDDDEMNAVIAAGDEALADQIAGRKAWLEPPACVHRANAARRHLGMPELPTADFMRLHGRGGGRRDRRNAS